MKASFVRSLGVAAMPLVTGLWMYTAAAADNPQYTYLGVGYQWSDVNFAVKQEGGQHEGVRVDGSLGLFETGDFGLHLVAEWFDGDFTGVGPDQDSSAYAVGLGASYALTESLDLVARGQFINVELDNIDEDGYSAEGLVRAVITENVELEVGYRYSELDDSDISNNDVLIALGYEVNDWLSFRLRGVVFDDDTGFDFGVRINFAPFIGRDSLFSR